MKIYLQSFCVCISLHFLGRYCSDPYFAIRKARHRIFMLLACVTQLVYDRSIIRTQAVWLQSLCLSESVLGSSYLHGTRETRRAKQAHPYPYETYWETQCNNQRLMTQPMWQLSQQGVRRVLADESVGPLRLALIRGAQTVSGCRDTNQRRWEGENSLVQVQALQGGASEVSSRGQAFT